MCLLEKRLWIR